MSFYRSAMRQKKEREYTDRELFRRYIRHLAPFKKNIMFIAVYIIIQALCDLIAPLLVGFATDEFYKDFPRFTLIIFAACGYLSLQLINWIIFSAQRVQYGKYIPIFLEKLRYEIFQKIQKQDMSFFDKRSTGKLNSIVVNDTLDFTNTALLISDAMGNLFISIFTFIILLYYNVSLALITIAGIPVLFILMYLLRRVSRRASLKYRKSISAVNSSIVESIEGIHVSKSFGQEIAISQQFEDINREYLKRWMDLTAVTHFWRPLINSLTAIVLCIVLYFGFNMILKDEISPGTVVLFILYLQTFFRPIMVLARFFPELQGGMASFERILGIIDTKSRVNQNSDPYPITNLEGKIEFKNVEFRYEKENTVFEKLNLIISKGEKLAIVGHTGAGKTSLAALLGRYYEFQGGSIIIDGHHDIRNIELESYRKQIGKVEQDVFLFPGTLLENITYGRKEATEEEVIKVLKIVQAYDFVKALPKGIHTQIGERGKELSAGQRQLISFARAILLNPSILILDEATSSVDAYTESMIQEALDEILKNRTAIIIAHRLSTITSADRILVMDHGKIVEEGTHEELLTQEGKYASLYNQYFVHQSWEWQSQQVRD